MKHIKRIFESVYDYKNDPVINDLKDLSLDLIDGGATLNVFLYNDNIRLGHFRFNHESENFWNFYDFPGSANNYTFYYQLNKENDTWTLSRDGDSWSRSGSNIFTNIDEIESIISEMHPNVNIKHSS